ncbi:MAG TPA: SRPBCC family protein [Thermoleophilaceae bacterium]|nr:SRPBCC family protein [Thermoleophilaceae bacterium]
MRLAAEARVSTAAPRELIWEVLIDVPRYAEWGEWSESVLEREGSPQPGGAGSIRRMRRTPVTVREEVLEAEPPSLLRYRLLSGIPVRDYEAVVRISEQGEIHWRSEFAPRLPGTGRIMRALIGRVLRDVASAVAAEAERRAGY